MTMLMSRYLSFAMIAATFSATNEWRHKRGSFPLPVPRGKGKPSRIMNEPRSMENETNKWNDKKKGKL